MGWKKGQSGNPKGRSPIVLPEVRKAIAESKNTIPIMVIRLLSMGEAEYAEYSRKQVQKIERLIIQCIDRIEIEGNTQALRFLLEMVFGKFAEDQPKDKTVDEQKATELYERVKVLESIPREKLAEMVTKAVADGSDEVEVPDAE